MTNHDLQTKTIIPPPSDESFRARKIWYSECVRFKVLESIRTTSFAGKYVLELVFCLIFFKQNECDFRDKDSIVRAGYSFWPISKICFPRFENKTRKPKFENRAKTITGAHYWIIFSKITPFLFEKKPAQAHIFPRKRCSTDRFRISESHAFRISHFLSDT